MKNQTDDATELPSNTTGAERKPYETPTLRVFGDVAALTRAVGNVGKTDGGMGAKSKTA
jgi:hypothetical protein